MRKSARFATVAALALVYAVAARLGLRRLRA